MAISARNCIPGKVVKVKEGIVTAEVVLDIGGGKEIVAVITLDSAKRLDLKVGAEASAVVKATEVMIQKQ